MENLHWNRKIIEFSTIYFVFVLLVSFMIFPGSLVGFHWIFVAFLLMVLFFSLSRFFYNNWVAIPTKKFLRRLFIYSVIFRFASVLLLYFLYDTMTGVPFEPYAADSINYHNQGLLLAREFSKGNFGGGGLLYNYAYSDYGFNIFIGLIYWVFGDHIIVVRLFNAVFQAFSLVVFYRSCRIIFDEGIARLTSVMMMLFPAMLYYSGMHLKESIMIFIMLFTIYKGISFLIDPQNKVLNIFLFVIGLISLFYFRNFLAAIILLAFLFYWIQISFYSGKNWILNFFLGSIGFALVLYLMNNYGLMTELYGVIERSPGQLGEEMSGRSYQSGYSLTHLASIPILAIASIPAPFPNLSYIPGQENTYIQIGSAFIRGVLVFFSIAGLWHCIRYKFRTSSVIIMVFIAYLFGLAISGQVTSHRFQLVSVPFLLVFAADGMQRLRFNVSKRFMAYLFFMMLIILAWNFVRLKGRGLI